MTHRGRLTAVSAATAAALLGIVFAGVVIASRAQDLAAQARVLRVSLAQARQEVMSSPDHPDLGEVASPNPGMNLASFDRSGHVIAKIGALPLTDSLSDGIQRVGSTDVLVMRSVGKGGAIVAALPWREQAASIRRLAIMLALLLAPLTAFAALATWLAARATFAPLERMTREAESMSESLSKRLIVEDSQEFGVFAEKLNAFLGRLEESVLKQERFVADAAHELRTPLTVLLGRIETSLSRERAPGEYVDTLRGLLGEIERLSQLVEMLLQSASPQSGPAPVTNLADAMERAHARWVDRFIANGVELNLSSVECGARILELEIDMVLDNLLSNALRASPRGTQCAMIERVEGANAVISVEDQGGGIPAELADKVFDRFVRADSGRTRSAGGFGIGLSVCRRLVSLRGGSIEVDKGYRQGARLVVTLPGA